MNKQKNLIIGCIDNYEWKQILPWVNSINQHVTNCEKIMLVYRISNDCLAMLRQHGFTVYQSTLNSQIVVQRFYDIWKILSATPNLKEIGWILTTDVKDVVFQSCPFEWLNSKAPNYDLVSSSENISYENETWSKNNALQCFGQPITNLLLPHTIYNAGVIAGKAEFISNLCLINYLLSLASKSNNPDQTTYNILLNTVLKYCKVYKPTEKEHWAAQLGTTLDLSRPYSANNLNIEQNPYFTENGIVNSDQNKYVIVHQYDRISHMHEFFTQKYGK